MEEEVRRILRERLASPQTSPGLSWVDANRPLFEPLGGLKLPKIERELARDPADFSGTE